MPVMTILELNFKEPTNKVLNLKLTFNNKVFWRTGVEVYFLYKLHSTQFPRSLRPAFPTSLLDFDFPTYSQISDEEAAEYFGRLKERLEHFFETFFKICGHELEALKEFQEFIDDRIQSVEFSKDLDATEANILPVKEWFPATSRFIRSSLFRIRQRSPSPHLEMDAVEIKADSFADEKRLAMQRVRLADLEPNRTDLIPFQIESADGLDAGPFFKDLALFDQRKDLLEKSLKNITYLGNTLSGCKNLLESINQVVCEDSPESGAFFDLAVFERNADISEEIRTSIDKLNEFVRDPLQVQMDDVYSLVRGFNERIFALKAFDTALIERLRSCQLLDRIQSEAIEAMDRAQGSLSLLTTSSTAFDRKIAAKNAEIEKRIRRVEECTADFDSINRNGAEQFSVWEQITDSFILNKIKSI